MRVLIVRMMARSLQLVVAVVALSPCQQAGATMPAMTHTVVPVPPGAQMKPGCATK
eukprot:COSAG02_NODE_63761_length_262_cov_0.889571_1_plen_55_part_01